MQATLVHTEIHTLISANYAEDHEFHVKSIEASAWFVRLYSFYRVAMSLYSVFTAFFLLTVYTSDTVSLQLDVRLLIKRAQT